jgi:hypothetical protein
MRAKKKVEGRPDICGEVLQCAPVSNSLGL